MTTLACRHLTRDCVDTLSAIDSAEIQKVYLTHIHVKHQQQWNQMSRQFRSVSLVTVRDRFLDQQAADHKTSKVL